ncbi:MAG: agmatinase [Planctomycetota bacterium]|jgi:agmatinase
MGAANESFLGLTGEFRDPAGSRYAILPVPYEGTVSYKTGTAAGPSAIIEASQQVELFDCELRGEFFRCGVATYPAVEPAVDPAEQMRRVKKAARPIMQAGEFLLTLGGEHSITAPLVELAVELAGPISVLQIDAHADLRDSYGRSKFSHACVMRRVLETTDRICQVGIRSFAREVYDDCRQQVDKAITAETVNTRADWIDQALALLDEKVYLTVDMDGLDPSIAPGVGTPEPGGLTWQQVTGLLKRLCAERQVVAADIVEVRPIPPNHVTEFLAAKLAYKIIAYTQL